MPTVAFYEAFEEEQAAIKKYLPESIEAQLTDKTIQESGDTAPPASLISIRTQSHIPEGWEKGLKGVLTRSHGYDHLLKYQRESKSGIALGFLESYCARAVAEQAVMAAMILLRKLKKQVKNFETFRREGLTGRESKGRKILVAGVGNIGGEIVRIARGLEMDVKGFDIDHRIKGLDYVSLEQGAAWADVMVCALPLTEETAGMIGAGVLRKTNPGLIYVNISRGEISPVADLKDLLDEGILGGISMDVYPDEAHFAHRLRNKGAPDTPDGRIIDDLARRDNVLFTPHNAFNTQEALDHKASLSAGAISYFLKHGTFPTPVPGP